MASADSRSWPVSKGLGRLPATPFPSLVIPTRKALAGTHFASTEPFCAILQGAKQKQEEPFSSTVYVPVLLEVFYEH